LNAAHIEPDQHAPSGQGPLARSFGEEVVHSLTHGVGLLLSVAGAWFLVSRAIAEGNAWRVTGCAIFALALIAVYAASTLSHAVFEPGWRRAFRTLDQACIYLLIVGTYTPLALEYLRSGWWWLLFACMWAVAIVGFVSKTLFSHRIDAVTVWSYVLLGWMPILVAPAYVGIVPSAVLWWVLIGGLCYTAGTVFLVLDRRHLHFHAIWHLFVMAGSICHYGVVFLFVARAGTVIP
jgi:hemolysin III